MNPQSLTFALATALFASTAFAQMPEPASLLLFPVIRTNASTISIISVTNTNRTPATPTSLGGSTNVHFYWHNVQPNPGDPFNPIGCTVFDRVEFLTPTDNLSVSMACSDPIPPGGGEGYLVLSAQSPGFFNRDWSFNYLMGSIVHIDGASNLTYSLNAIPFRSPLADQAATDLNANGRQDFDGIEYEALRDWLSLDQGLGLINPSIALVNLTGGPSHINTVVVSAWNDNEVPLSGSIAFRCWFDVRASVLSLIFTDAFLGLTMNDPQELDLLCIGVGFTEPYWIEFDSVRVDDPNGNFVTGDGALAGMVSGCPGGRLLWMGGPLQLNGSQLGL
ncbi:MAG: hypothetical protein KDB80_10165 [Planctomycetes bacterium]|nr:hypothetical protein [Planctomycetota bacterium]